jgi:hypothetical protein
MAICFWVGFFFGSYSFNINSDFQLFQPEYHRRDIICRNAHLVHQHLYHIILHKTMDSQLRSLVTDRSVTPLLFKWILNILLLLLQILKQNPTDKYLVSRMDLAQRRIPTTEYQRYNYFKTINHRMQW